MLPTDLAALNLPIANTSHGRAAFQVRFAAQVAVPESWPEEAPGWAMPRHAKDTGWVSRTRRDALRLATENVLHWRGGDDLPVVLELELDRVFPQGARVVWTDGVPAASLAAVDLVPLQPLSPRSTGFGAGQRRIPAMLGLVFAAAPDLESCTVRQYLDLVGARRALWKLPFSAPRPGAKRTELTVGGLFAALRASFDAGAPLDLIRAPRSQSPDEVYVIQAVHVPANPWCLDRHAESTDAEPDREAAVALRAADLVLSASRPRPAKILPPARRFLLPSSPATLYMLHDRGMGTLLGPTQDRFNQEQKPRIVMEAHYLQWLIARHGAHINLDWRRLLASFEQPNRKSFMEHSGRFFSALPEDAPGDPGSPA